MDRPAIIRIMLSELPGLMGGLVRDAIKGQRDMRIVGEITRNVDVMDSASNGRCDVVVAALSPDALVPAPYHGLLFGEVPVPFVALDPDGRRLQAYSRSVRREFAGKDLVAVIRKLANPDADPRTPDSIGENVDDSAGSSHVA